MGRAERCSYALFNAEEQVPEQIEQTADEKDAYSEEGNFIAPWDTLISHGYRCQESSGHQSQHPGLACCQFVGITGCGYSLMGWLRH
jgi:hypothetical protein